MRKKDLKVVKNYMDNETNRTPIKFKTSLNRFATILLGDDYSYKPIWSLHV